MIEDFYIDPSLGYPSREHPSEYQVGFFILADDDMAQRFRQMLWQNGLHIRPTSYLPSKKPEFTHFTFVSAPDSRLDKAGIYKRLRSLCKRYCANPSGQSEDSPDYETWELAFDNYLQDYRNQHYASETERHAPEMFDKGKAYELIQSSQYQQAESYLDSFATDAPPFLVPAYLIFLYHAWERSGRVIETHKRYASEISAGDVDHRVVEWIVQAYLNGSPARPEEALAVLDDFLPEFQRQGIAEQLLTLRAQARALQGQLPQTLADLHDYVTGISEEDLNARVGDLLDVVSGLTASASEIQCLLDTIASRLDPSARWRIELERSRVAHRADLPNEALTHLQTIIDESPSDLSSVDLDALRLSAVDLHLALGDARAAVDVLKSITFEDFSSDERRAYWNLQGQALAKLNDEGGALEALHQAYEAGTRRPEVLRLLAHLAYREGDSRLAWRVYTDLLHTGFDPSPEDRLYAGILVYYEEDDPFQALDYLRPTLAELPAEVLPTETLPMAYETLTGCLLDIQASAEEIADVVASWADFLVWNNDLEGLIELVERIPRLRLDPPTTFDLLEAIEPVAQSDPVGRERLVEAYTGLYWNEVDISLRQSKPLPAYTLDLRRALFALDREQFNFAQGYLEEELKRARDAELIEDEFKLEYPEPEPLDLQDCWVAVAGGYAPMRRRVQEILETEHKLDRFTEVPPAWEAHLDETRVREAVQGADLIVVVPRCMKHSGSDALKAVVGGSALEKRIRYAAGKGQSSVLRVVREYFEGQ